MQSMQLDAIIKLVQDSFQAVDALIIESLHSKTSLINDLSQYILQSSGKRIRPLIVLLIAKAYGYEGTHHIPLAAIIEFVHTATLLHDDVVDSANCRRGKKTVNSVWGNEAAVLMGDFLYSKAFQMLVSVGNLSVMKILADATNIMAEGEALQLLDRHKAETTENTYLNVIRCKTAKLFEASAQIGAILANADPKRVLMMTHFGIHLGTAFQLVDDVLDYRASPDKTGKNLGNDLAEGKITLPLIHILKNGTAEEIQLVKEAIREGGHEYFSAVQKIIETSGSIEYTLDYAALEITRAKKALDNLDPSPYKEAAFALANFALKRDC